MTDARSLAIKQSRKFWMRWRVRVGYPVAVIYWLLAAPTPRSIVVGAIFAACGLLVRGAASGHLRKDEELTTTGPYAVTRNPLYFGSALLATGFIVAGHSWWPGLLVGIYFAVFYYAVIRAEEGDLRKKFGPAFEAYAARVPPLLPSFIRGRAAAPLVENSASNSFSWARYRRNREYQAFIGTIAGIGVVWLRMWIRARFGH
jgi:protein-S-isoprenylcysteine O-methyltransferase Ste14